MRLSPQRLPDASQDSNALATKIKFAQRPTAKGILGALTIPDQATHCVREVACFAN